MKHRTGHLFKRGDSYYLRWAVNGQVFSRALRDDQDNPITTKPAAEQAQQKAMASFIVGDEVAALEAIAGKLAGRKTELAAIEDEKNPPVTVAQAWVEYLASPDRPDTGAETLKRLGYQWSAFVAWLKDNHGDVVTLRGVTEDMAREYAGTLNHGKLTPNTYNKHLGLLTLVFRILKRKARLVDNPWTGIARKKLCTQSRRELTVDELRKVCQAAQGEMRLLFALGIYTGLRLGDCCTLRWCETDLHRGIITRIPNKTARYNPRPVILPIHPTLAAMLSEIPTQDRGDYVLPKMAEDYRKDVNKVTNVIQGHFQTCGIHTHKTGSGENGKRAIVEVGFHSLRHSFVSMCRASNVPLSVVESLVGHGNPAMTRLYTHTGEVAASRAIACLPAVMGDATPTPTKPAPEAILREARAIAESITVSTWEQARAALLALLPI